MTTETTPHAEAEHTGAAAPAAPVAPAAPTPSEPVVTEPAASDASLADDAFMAEELKSAIFDSAELATRSAALAAKAGMEMHQAAAALMTTTLSQQKMNKILLGVFGGVLVLALGLFTFLSFRLQDRVSQLDSMILAVGKRVITMDSSVSLFDSVSDIIKDVSQKQDVISNNQAKLELRIDEVIKTIQAASETKPKPPEDKGKEMLRLLEDINSKLSQQSNSTKAVSTQIQRLQGSLPDAGGIRRELEEMAKHMKERPATETAPSGSQPSAVPPVAPKPRERLVQYPRTSPAAAAGEKP